MIKKTQVESLTIFVLAGTDVGGFCGPKRIWNRCFSRLKDGTKEERKMSFIWLNESRKMWKMSRSVKKRKTQHTQKIFLQNLYSALRLNLNISPHLIEMPHCVDWRWMKTLLNIILQKVRSFSVNKRSSSEYLTPS